MQALQDHNTVINAIDAVFAGTEKLVLLLRSRRNEERDGAEMTLGVNVFDARAPVTGNVRSPSEDRRVAGTTTSVLEAKRSLWQE